MALLHQTAPARLAPGIVICLGVGVVSTLIASRVPVLSGLIIAIVVGIIWRNVAPYPEPLTAGTSFAQKQILRAGIVLLGLQIPVGVILGLGPWVLCSIVAAVAITFMVSMAIGRRLGLSWHQCLLMSSGFSICGAAAVAGTDSVIDAEEKDVASAIAMVVVFGSLLIGVMPLLAGVLGLTDQQAGIWIGLSTHEVAQVVAAGGIVGGSALAVAVTVKLARVLMLAPVLAVISWADRRRDARTWASAAPVASSHAAAANSATAHSTSGTAASAGGTKRPPIVPPFILGFIICVAIGSLGIPEPVAAVATLIQSILLATAMFALGLSVDVRSLVKVGGKPALLGLASTVCIVLIGGAAVLVPSALGLSAF